MTTNLFEYEWEDTPTDLLTWPPIVEKAVLKDQKNQVCRLGSSLPHLRRTYSKSSYQDVIAKNTLSGLITVGSNRKINITHSIHYDDVLAKCVGINGTSILATSVEIDAAHDFLEPSYIDTAKLNQIFKETCKNKMKEFWSPTPKLPTQKRRGSGSDSGDESDGTTCTNASARSISLIPKKSKNILTSLNNFILVPPVVTAMLLTLEGELSADKVIDTMSYKFKEYIKGLELAEEKLAKMIQYFKWIIVWMGAANAQLLKYVDWQPSSEGDSMAHLTRIAPSNVVIFLRTEIWQHESISSKDWEERNLPKNIRTISGLPSNTTTLEVDLDFPGNTFPINVYPVDELYGVDGHKIYKGFSLVVEVDPRWVYDDKSRDFFTARIIGSDSVLVGIPAMPYDVMYNLKQFMLCGKGVVKAMDIARNKIWKDEDRLIKHFLLTFPVPHDSKKACVQLSTKEIYTNKDDVYELELLYPDVASKHGEHEEYMKNQFVVWNVARIDVESHKIGRPENTGPKISKAEAARLRIGG